MKLAKEANITLDYSSSCIYYLYLHTSHLQSELIRQVLLGDVPRDTP